MDRDRTVDPSAGWTLEQWRDEARFQADLVAQLNRDLAAARSENEAMRQDITRLIQEATDEANG
jgi:hypothetical protein